ncbi:MAG: sugar transferase [Ilumatobacteraceae bacterium]
MGRLSRSGRWYGSRRQPGRLVRDGARAACYELTGPPQRRQGLTCLWQVSGRSLTSMHERIALDDHYPQHWSMRADLRVLASTPAAVVRAEGAR